MQALTRRNRTTANIWPGFVDALATLLMVIIFLLMIFVVAQFYLNDALIGRDRALDRLNEQVSELAELLSLERSANQNLRTNVAQISAELQSSLSERDDLISQMNTLLGVSAQLTKAEAELAQSEAERERLVSERQSLSEELEGVYVSLEDANRTIQADKETIELQLRQLSELQQDIVAMTALREELARRIEEESSRADAAESAVSSGAKSLAEERLISAAAKAQVARLNRQLAEISRQIAALNEALEASEKKEKAQQVQIANLGQRLNAALAGKVQELARYRSEFFGRLRQVLGDRRDIQIVGDRFVFQSEVLFASGSDSLAEGGKEQLAQLATTLKEIAQGIPDDINWVLRVDGHTDRVPISTGRFPSNWELSTARAISVVKFLISQGIPPSRFAATGFGEFQPLDERDDEIAYRRNRRIEMKLDQR
ncbi:MAG: peptidoglycan -binding protein [Alphaproteobacteria bacterium]